MKMRWEPRLMEELVRAEAMHDKAFAEVCQNRLEPVYGLPDEERGEAFGAVYGALFDERQLGKPLSALLVEFPTLQALEEMLIFKAVSPREEGSELSRSRTKMGLKLRVERLREAESSRYFLLHELMHISDMLDPDFGYQDEPLDKFQERLVPLRYQVLWDSYIDGRLEDRHGREIVPTKEEWQRDFERQFAFLPRRQRAAAFQKLWSDRDMTHAQLLELSKDPTKLAVFGAGMAEVSLAPISGTLCPLCQFPTFDWANPKAEILAVIREDFPTWTLEEGICERCHEYYQTRCIAKERESRHEVNT